MADLEDWLRTQKQLKAADPDSAPSLHAGNDPLTTQLRTWVVDQAPAAERAAARLQLNVALSVLTSAFEQWDAEQPFKTFLRLARRYLEQLACAFERDE